MRRGLLDQHRRAIRERPAQRRQPSMDQRRHHALREPAGPSGSGSNHPTVRLVGAR
jgi:hypothetical protein